MNEKIEIYFSSKPAFNILFIVSLSTSILEKLMIDMGYQYGLVTLSLNKELSQVLISEPKEGYTNKVIEWLVTKTLEKDVPVLFGNIDTLFEPTLGMDPLGLFKQISKQKQIIVLWPGSFSNNTLTYASPEHAHFRRWVNPGVELIQL